MLINFNLMQEWRNWSIGEGSLFSGQIPGNLGLRGEVMGRRGVGTGIGNNTDMFSGGMSSTGRNLSC